MDIDAKTEIKTCSQHGEYQAKGIKMFKDYKWSPCPACQAEREQAEQDRLNQQREAEHRRRVENAVYRFNQCVPARFKDCNLDNYETPCAKTANALKLASGYVEAFGKLHQAGAGLILSGSLGTGKTHLAIGIGKELAKTGANVYYKNLINIIRDIRRSWSDSAGESEEMVIKRYIGYDLLIIDEVGVQRGSDDERTLIFDVINGRYEECQPTIIISNLTKEDIGEIISTRLVDRITDGGGGTIVFNWGSHRNQRRVA